MARQYTIGPQLAGDIILIDRQNDEVNQAVGELNGSLDQNNMPLNSVSRAELVAPSYTSIVGPPAQKNYVYPSQAYYVTEVCNTFLINVDEWALGWNTLESSAFPANRSGFVLDFVAQEGMLKGEAVVDFTQRQSYLVYYRIEPGDPGPPPAPGATGYIEKVKDQHTGELGVFVNDVLVARTGPIYIAIGRFTYTIPYATPVKSGPVHIDVRWLIDYKNEEEVYASGTIIDIGINQVYPIGLEHRLLWCRNQYR